jgi:Na+/phosphate symporter
VAQLKESIDALQIGLEKTYALRLVPESVNAKGFKIISQLIIKLNDSVVEIQTAIKTYRSQLEETVFSPEEVVRAYENIGEQIIKISNFTEMIQLIQVDLPGFIQRSS